MKNTFIQHLMKENIGIGPIDTLADYNSIIGRLSFNRIGTWQTTWEYACEHPNVNFAFILDTNSFVLDEANQASKYITPDQFFDNLYKESNWELN